MDLPFIIKKCVSAYLTPIGIGLEAIALGFLLLAFSTWHQRKAAKKPQRPRARRIGFSLLVAGSLFLYLCSLSPVANGLLYSLEKRNPPAFPKDERGEIKIQPECIVVLSGGSFAFEETSAFSNLSGATLGRVAEAVMLWKEHPDTDFIVTGGVDETDSMAFVAASLGVAADKIVKESESKDTADHPVKLKPIIDGRPFFLVTSASHMPRSLKLFRAQGYDPVAVAVHFRAWKRSVDPGERRFVIDSLIPSSGNLAKTTIAMHEYYGLIWGTLSGQFKASSQSSN